jgi:N6-adenosine-specific RNA methylase IME4
MGKIVLPTCAEPSGFRALSADPPWLMRNRGTRLAPSYAGQQRKKRVYKVMKLADLIAMGPEVKRIAAKDSFLFLWSPGALVLDGTATLLARAWGFEPKQLLPWIKTTKDGRPRMGGGNYTRLCSEYVLLCRRGKAKRLVANEIDVMHSPRMEHSAKPDCSYEKIERLVAGPYVELFARRRFSPKWTVFGNQAPVEGA